MILPAQTIRQIKPLTPFCERSVTNGMSYGLSHAGYDVRIAENIYLRAKEFSLASTVEKFEMPNDLVGLVHDKSSWARRGLSLFNTVIEPGWRGYLTLELVNNSDATLSIDRGTPIAQILFVRTEEPVETAYSGKYQDQQAGPQSARIEASAKEAQA